MSYEPEVAIVYIPCGSEEEAVRMATALIEEGLIACANVFASRSLYRWGGELADQPEYVLFCKTAATCATAAAERAAHLHSYDVPCIITLKPQAVNEEYATWVQSQVLDRVGGEALCAGSNTGSKD
jgi:periplasmic divalent cation tolerance protein